MNKNIKIVIADDHPLLRQGLAQILSMHTHLKLVGEASNGMEAMTLVQSEKPDIIILDVQMPIMDGFEVAKIIQKDHLPTKIIFLTMFKEEEFIRNVFKLGIKGYILKESALLDIVNCIEAVMNDNYFLSPQVSHLILTQPKVEEDKSGLTKTEREILKMIGKGKSSKEIAEELFNSQKTIENHRSNICKKLGITGNSALLKYALRLNTDEKL